MHLNLSYLHKITTNPYLPPLSLKFWHDIPKAGYSLSHHTMSRYIMFLNMEENSTFT